jgi:hypothetical protein
LSLIQKLAAMFESVQLETFLLFWFYLASKVRMAGRLRTVAARIFRALNNGLSTVGIRGAYFTFEGRNP